MSDQAFQARSPEAGLLGFGRPQPAKAEAPSKPLVGAVVLVLLRMALLGCVFAFAYALLVIGLRLAG